MLWTGFGAFGDSDDNRVESNPTARLVKVLGESDKSSVLEVSIEACDAAVNGLAEQEIVVHLGVSSQSDKIELERYAYNECTFRCKDERGAQPTGLPVERDSPPRLETVLDVGTIASELCASGYNVAVSEDPGRFVCNYLYYKSLRARRSKPTLFVHVPPFHEVEEIAQLETLRCLRATLMRRNIPPLILELENLGVSRERALAASAAGHHTVEEAMSFLFPEKEEELKMVLVARTDLSMTQGKIAAQAVHAALAAYRTAIELNPSDVLRWVDDGEKVVVVRAPDHAGPAFLYDRAEQATNLGLPTYLVADAGRTEVAPGSETVLAVGPGPAQTVDAITGDLRLL